MQHCSYYDLSFKNFSEDKIRLYKLCFHTAKTQTTKGFHRTNLPTFCSQIAAVNLVRFSSILNLRSVLPVFIKIRGIISPAQFSYAERFVRLFFSMYMLIAHVIRASICTCPFKGTAHFSYFLTNFTKPLLFVSLAWIWQYDI